MIEEKKWKIDKVFKINKVLYIIILLRYYVQVCLTSYIGKYIKLFFKIVNVN